MHIGKMDQYFQMGQEVPITNHGWFGMERRGIPARLWSQVTCGCCTWPPSCSLPPPMLLHLLLLAHPVILPRIHMHAHSQSHTHVMYCNDPQSTTVCIHNQDPKSFPAWGNVWKCVVMKATAFPNTYAKKQSGYNTIIHKRRWSCSSPLAE